MLRRECTLEKIQWRLAEISRQKRERITLAFLDARDRPGQRHRFACAEIVDVERPRRRIAVRALQPGSEIARRARERRPRCKTDYRAIALDQDGRMVRLRRQRDRFG